MVRVLPTQRRQAKEQTLHPCFPGVLSACQQISLIGLVRELPPKVTSKVWLPIQAKSLEGPPRRHPVRIHIVIYERGGWGLVGVHAQAGSGA